MLIECGANLPDGWQRGISAGDAHQSEEKSQFFAEPLLSNKRQRRAPNREGCNANKTNGNWSVRTDQGEFGNRRL